MKVYHGGVTPSTPSGHDPPKKPADLAQNGPEMASAVSAKFLKHLSTDPRLTDFDKRVMTQAASEMTAGGRWRGTDEHLSLTSPSSVYAALLRLAEHGYIAPLTRMEFGERDLIIGDRYASALRGTGRSRQNKETPGDQEIPGKNAEDNFAAEQNCDDSAPSAPGEEKSNQETPSEESLSRERPRKSTRRARRSESLDSDSFAEEKAEAKHSLEDLAKAYGVEHFPIDVLEAAHCFGDLPGAPHYAMVYSTMANSDQEIWAEAIKQVREHWVPSAVSEGRQPTTPRCYLAETVQGIVAKRAEAERVRQKDLFKRKKTAPTANVSDDELDSMMAQDPFADDPEDAADVPADAHVEDVPEQADAPAETPEDVSDAPASQDEPADAPVETQVETEPAAVSEAAPQPEPVASEEPAPAPHRPHKRRPVRTQIAPDPAVIADATKRLGLPDENNLASIYSGVCRGRLQVFLLVVRMAELSGAKSPIPFVIKTASENVDKDDNWLADRTDGLTAAQCTQKLKEFEQFLEDEKQRLNAPITHLGGFRSDQPAEIGAILATFPMDKGQQSPDNGIVLPASSQGWEALESRMTAERENYRALSVAEQRTCDDAGQDMARRKAGQTGHPDFDRWRRYGTYLKACAIVDDHKRAANVEASRDYIDENTPPIFQSDAEAQNPEDDVPPPPAAARPNGRKSKEECKADGLYHAPDRTEGDVSAGKIGAKAFKAALELKGGKSIEEQRAEAAQAGKPKRH